MFQTTENCFAHFNLIFYMLRMKTTVYKKTYANPVARKHASGSPIEVLKTIRKRQYKSWSGI